MPTALKVYEQVGPGIFSIDTGFQRPQFDASYLLVDRGCAAFIDTGPNAAVPLLLEALDHVGLKPADVTWVILTHVHLDHAGGAGALMQELPNARLAVHARGAKHMADPSRLMEGVRSVYGVEVAARDYGELVPVEAERIIQALDGINLTVGKRVLQVMETPGHAYHHICLWDAQTHGWFTGDTLGVSYPQLDFGTMRFGVPSTTPTQFDPEALQNSVARLMDRRPKAAYLTHFGAIRDVASQASQVLALSRDMVRIARECAGLPHTLSLIKAALSDLYRERLTQVSGDRTIDKSLSALSGDIELNSQGLIAWLVAQQHSG